MSTRDTRIHITKSRGGHYSLTVVHRATRMRVTYSKLELCGAQHLVPEAMAALEVRVAEYYARLRAHDRKVLA